MTLTYCVIDTGGSRSFPAPHAFLSSAAAEGEVVAILGCNVDTALAALGDRISKEAILLELTTECLGVHSAGCGGEDDSNVLGFARFRLGNSEPSNLVELVRQPCSREPAVRAAKHVFERAGLKVAVCNDFPGRIVNRLVRPYFNAALRRLDEGLATAADLDLTLRLGLGYPEGPIGLLEQTGLADHGAVTQALYEALGDPAYFPARRAQVAMQRTKLQEGRTSDSTPRTGIDM